MKYWACMLRGQALTAAHRKHSYPNGALLTVYHIRNELPFPRGCLCVRMRGADILAALEACLSPAQAKTRPSTLLQKCSIEQPDSWHYKPLGLQRVSPLVMLFALLMAIV